jgi:hypothetical protein
MWRQITKISNRGIEVSVLCKVQQPHFFTLKETGPADSTVFCFPTRPPSEGGRETLRKDT